MLYYSIKYIIRMCLVLQAMEQICSSLWLFISRFYYIQ